MSEIDYTNIASTSIATPAAGVVAAFVDLDKRAKTKDENGFIRNGMNFNNFSIGPQTPAATTRTYITGSQVPVPSGKLQVGTFFRWTFNITKTAAGIAASTYDIAIGVAGTTADAAVVSFTKPAGTAAIDEGKIVIEAIVRSIGAAGVMVAEFSLIHNLAATGHATIPCVVVNTVSAGFDTTVAALFVGLCITSGAADAITIQQVLTEVGNL